MKKFCIVATFIIVTSFLSQLFASCPNIIQYYPTTSGYTWQQALKYCESQTKDGYSDWRLANINELLSLCLDGCLETNNSFGYPFWSSTTVYAEDNSAWVVKRYNNHCASSMQASDIDDNKSSNKTKKISTYYPSMGNVNDTPLYYGVVCVRDGN